MKRVAIYCRVSTADQNTEMQIAELREYVARRDWRIHAEYIDNGVSGTKVSRPKLDSLMADARRRRFDVVLVWRFDRFARSTSHLLTALEEFRNLGVDFISQHESVDTTTPLGKAVFTIVSAIAELERSIIVERVKAGVARAKAKGTQLGRPTGSKVDSSTVQRMLAEGHSFRDVAAALHASVGTIHRLAKPFKKTPVETAGIQPMKVATQRTVQ